jgi:hypothetical protein
MGIVPPVQHCPVQSEQGSQFHQRPDQVVRDVRHPEGGRSREELREEVDVDRPVAGLAEGVGPVTSKFDLDGDARRLAGDGIKPCLDEGAVVDEPPVAVHADRLGVVEAAHQRPAEAVDQPLDDVPRIALRIYIGSDAENETLAHVALQSAAEFANRQGNLHPKVPNASLIRSPAPGREYSIRPNQKDISS